MIRFFSFFAAFVIVLTLAVPVSAAGVSDWVELLETATVNDSGNNLITMTTTSATFRVKTPVYMRCTKVDMLIAHASGQAPTSVRVRYNNTYYNLTLAKIDAYTTRAYTANILDNKILSLIHI